MQKIITVFISLLLFSISADAQFSRYIIKFKDKGSNPFSISNPSQYLSQRAIDRRLRYNIAIDSSDLPVTPRYIDSLRAAGNVTILNTSKWLNQVAIRTTDAAALIKINSLPFVISSTPIAPLLNNEQPHPDKFGQVNENDQQDIMHGTTDNLVDYYNYGRSNGQVKIHKGEFLHNLGFRGEGMQMAVLDAGFFRYLTLPTFDSIRINNQILGTWDFVTNDPNVNEDNAHGMQCLSTIAANIPNNFVGTAPKTSFYLYRTEDVSSEYPVEEQNMAAGFERADSAGVDVCSVSLGYFQFTNSMFNYTYSDMNGDISISTRAADMAAKKGMMIVAANGNQGSDPMPPAGWHYLITPADGDSVLAVGAVDSLSNVAPFSSYGPSSDGQIKPNLASVGWRAMVANTTTGLPVPGNGTSFACPNLAGIVTCLWQAFPEVSNMSLMNAMQQNATRTANPDDRIGYGIPDAKKAFVYLIKQLYTQQASMNLCTAQLSFNVKADDNMAFSIERKLPSETNYTTISTQQGGDNFINNNFTFNDNLSLIDPGVIMYRTRMDISSDTTFYIDSMAITLMPDCEVSENSFVIAPNPVHDKLNITFSRVDAANIQLVIYNSAGQRMHSSVWDQPTGISTRTIATAAWSAGTYFVNIFVNRKKFATKKILKR